MTERLNPEVGFLIYDSRSGSTLLASLLNAHPDIFVSLEAEYILTVMKMRRESGCFPKGKAIRSILLKDRRLNEWGIDYLQTFESLLVADENTGVDKFTESLLEAAAASSPFGPAKPNIFILKQGLLTEYLDELRELWPNAKLIHIYRDGRAVFASKKRNRNIDTNLPMATDPVGSACRWTKIQKSVHDTATSGLLIEVCYEKIVENTELNLEKIWKFIGVNSTQAVDLSHDNYAKRIPSSQKTIHPLVGKAIDSQRMHLWKNELSIVEIWKYETMARESLERRGYDRIYKNFASFLTFAISKIKQRIKSLLYTWHGHNW